MIPDKHGDLSHSSSHKGLSLTDHYPSSPCGYPWVTMVEELGDQGTRPDQPPRGMRQFHSRFFGWTWSPHPSLTARGEHHPGDSGTWFQDTQLGLGLRGEREALHAFQGSCNSTTSRQ